jgi:hypothetical protein
MTEREEQLTKNSIGHLMPELEEIGTPEIVKKAIKKCICSLVRKLCGDDNENFGNK